MLESSSDWPTRKWIERAVINQYRRLECEKSVVGSRAILSARGHRRNDKPPIRCHLCSGTGHSALQYCEFQIIRRKEKPNGYQRDGEQGGNGGGGGNDGGGGNGGGGGGNRGGGVSQNRNGGGGKQIKNNKDSESGNKPAHLDCLFCLGYHRASECPNRSGSATAPVTSNSQHGALLGSVRANIGAGLLVAKSTHPALVARGASRKRHEHEY